MSYTAWVWKKRAPASTLAAMRAISPSRSGFPGLTTAPMQRSGAPRSALPAWSWPWLSPRTVSMISTEPRSKTALASGWSPCDGASPVMSTTFETPSAAAASRSAWIAIRLRSRAVIWRMGSIPSSSRRRAAPTGAMLMRALWESVRLNASTCPASERAASSIGVRSSPLGGVSSLVTTNRPDRTRSVIRGMAA